MTGCVPCRLSSKGHKQVSFQRRLCRRVVIALTVFQHSAPTFRWGGNVSHNPSSRKVVGTHHTEIDYHTFHIFLVGYQRTRLQHTSQTDEFQLKHRREPPSSEGSRKSCKPFVKRTQKRLKTIGQVGGCFYHCCHIKSVDEELNFRV